MSKTRTPSKLFERLPRSLHDVVVGETRGEAVRWVRTRRGDSVILGWGMVCWPLAVLITGLAALPARLGAPGVRGIAWDWVATAAGLVALPFVMRVFRDPTAYVITDRYVRVVSRCVTGRIVIKWCETQRIGAVEYAPDTDESSQPLATGTVSIEGPWCDTRSTPSDVSTLRLSGLEDGESVVGLLNRLRKRS